MSAFLHAATLSFWMISMELMRSGESEKEKESRMRLALAALRHVATKRLGG